MARFRKGMSQDLYRTIGEIIAFAWILKGKFPAAQDLDMPAVQKDVTGLENNY